MKRLLLSLAVAIALLPNPARADDIKEFFNVYVSFLKSEPATQADLMAVEVFNRLPYPNKLDLYQLGIKYCGFRLNGGNRSGFMQPLDRVINNQSNNPAIREVNRSSINAALTAAEQVICPNIVSANTNPVGPPNFDVEVRQVACFHFKKDKLMRRDRCTLRTYENHATLTWSDKVATRIDFIDSDTTLVDGERTYTYQRMPSNLQEIRGSRNQRERVGRMFIDCYQVIDSPNSICFK